MATRLGLVTEMQPTDWRHGADPAGDRGAASRGRGPRDQGRLRRAQRDLDRRREPHRRGAQGDRRARGHPALLLVDTISSLASIDYRMDEWGVDVTVAGSQKGLMLPPGLCFNAVSDKALAASKAREAAEGVLGLGRDARGQQDRLLPVHAGDEPALRPARSARRCSQEEGLENVFARHARHGEATRRAVRAWGLEVLMREPGGVQRLAHGRGDARGPRRRRAAASGSSRRSTCRSAPGSASSRARCSASATSAISTISRSRARCAGVEMGLKLAQVPHRAGGAAGGARVPSGRRGPADLEAPVPSKADRGLERAGGRVGGPEHL